jgi:hypothetical protein
MKVFLMAREEMDDVFCATLRRKRPRMWRGEEEGVDGIGGQGRIFS